MFREIFQLAETYKSLTFVDECHATGFLGSSGRGTEEYHSCQGRATVINSTLGECGV